MNSVHLLPLTVKYPSLEPEQETGFWVVLADVFFVVLTVVVSFCVVFVVVLVERVVELGLWVVVVVGFVVGFVVTFVVTLISSEPERIDFTWFTRGYFPFDNNFNLNINGLI